MSPRFVTGLVLRRRPFREEDRFITIYTEELGKLELMAKGARKAASRLAGVLEPATVIRAGLVRGRAFDRLTTARSARVYPRMKASLSAVLAAGVLLQAADLVTVTEHPEHSLFAKLCQALGDLDDGVEPTAVLGRGLFAVLHAGGLKPNLKTCERCKRDLSGSAMIHLNLENGGLLCAQERLPLTTMALTQEELKILQVLDSESGKTGVAVVSSAVKLVGRMFESLVERPLSSLALVNLSGR